MVSENLSRFTENADRLTVVGSVVLGVTALMLLVSIQDSFNQIWRVGRDPAAMGPFGPLCGAVCRSVRLLLAASFSLSTYLFAARPVD